MKKKKKMFSLNNKKYVRTGSKVTLKFLLLVNQVIYVLFNEQEMVKIIAISCVLAQYFVFHL